MLQSYDMLKNNITQNHWHRVSFPYPRAEAHLNQPRSTLRPKWGTPLTPGTALWSPNQCWQPLGCSLSCFVPVPPFTLSSAHLLQLMQCHRHEQRAPSTAQLINKGKLIPALGWPYSPDRDPPVWELPRGSQSHHQEHLPTAASSHQNIPSHQNHGSEPEAPHHCRTPEWRRSPSSRNRVGEPTGDVGGDLGERRLAKALAGAGPHGEQVGGAGVEVGEHVVGLIAQLGHRAPRARHVHRGV